MMDKNDYLMIALCFVLYGILVSWQAIRIDQLEKRIQSLEQCETQGYCEYKGAE